jgi:type I restriction enzyme S subunit
LASGFLFAFVQSKEFVDSLSDLVKGALYPAVTDSQVRAQVIPLPPLIEQQRIAAILTEQMAAVERARTAAEA